MLRGRWCIVFAIAGLAVGYPVGQHASSQTRAAQDRAETQNEAAPASTDSVENSLARIASTIEAAQADPAAQREEQRGEADLRAQRDMAKWAMWMFFAAATTTILSALGVFLIWRTLIHTRRAANFAGDAVVEGQKATKAAEGALEVQRNTAALQLRPYLLFAEEDDDDETKSFDEVPMLDLSFQNYGQTPAYSVGFRQGATFTKKPIGDLEPYLDSEVESFGTIGPGAKRGVAMDLKTLSRKGVADVKKGTRVLLLRFRLDYRLPNGRSDSDDITLVIDKEGWPEGYAPRITKQYRQKTK